MPTLSASDYTQYLKFKAAAATPIRPAIQTRSNATLSQSVLNANVLASQAAFVTTPATTLVTTGVPGVTVTQARTNIIDIANGFGSFISYVTSQPHGLLLGQTVTITGLTQGTLTVNPNLTGVVTGISSDTFFEINVGGSVSGSAGFTVGSFTNRVYYTTNNPHGLVIGDIATVTGVTTFTASDASVVAVPSSTTFVLNSPTTGSAVTGQSGSLSTSRYVSQPMSLRGLARVQAQPVVQTRSTPIAKSTLSWTSGTSGSVGSTTSSKIQRPGGLPAKNVVGTYTRLPQQAGW